MLQGGSLDVSGVASRVIVDRGGRAAVSGIVDYIEVAGEAHVSGMVEQVHLVDGGRVTIEGIVGSMTGQGSAMLLSGSVVEGVPIETTREVVR